MGIDSGPCSSPNRGGRARSHAARALALALALGASWLGCGSDRRFLVDASGDRVDPRPDAPRDEALDAPADAALDAVADAAPSAAPDAASLDATLDAALDAAAPEDAVVDAVEHAADATRDGALDEGARADAAALPDPRCGSAPTIDGTIGADWPSSALLVRNAVPSAWGPGLNELRALRVCYDEAALYLAVEGTVEAGNAIVVYLDRDFGTASGVGDLTVLSDGRGAFDDAVSAGFALGAGAAGFAPEAAWGTLGMASAPAGAPSERAGVRLFFPALVGGVDRRGDFAYVLAADTRCRAEAPGGCELALPWRALYEQPTGALPMRATFALTARLTNGTGTMSPNQALPEDDPATPRRIDRVLRFDVRR